MSEGPTFQELLTEYGRPFEVWWQNDDISSYVAEEDWRLMFEDAYLGEYDDPADWAYYFLRDTGQVNDSNFLERYFDYEAYARDCILGGDIWVHEEGYKTCYVYNNH